MLEIDEIGISKKSILSARNNTSSLQNIAIHDVLKLHVLASGSKGNCSLVENCLTHEGILIDCGISKKVFFERISDVNFDLKNLKGILITHEHSDHVKGIGVVTRGLKKLGIEIPIVTTQAIVNNSKELQKALEQCPYQTFHEWCSKSTAGISVTPFETSHDSVESFGFRFELSNLVLGYLTDSGYVTEQAHKGLIGSNLLALESNHDSYMLQNGPYPYRIKQRIASDKGHLSNTQAAEELEVLLHTGLKQIIAMHISETNNTYRLPVETLQKVITTNNHDALVCCSYQNRAVSI